MKKKYFPFYVLLFIAFSSCSQTETKNIDTAEFQVGYPKLKGDALEQLRSYPIPRYKPNNNFLRLFNWMDPYYIGGGGQDEIKAIDAQKRSFEIQEELGGNWNYYLVIWNPRYVSNEQIVRDTSGYSYIKLANKHPEIPLSAVIFWAGISPNKFGANYKQSNIYFRQDLAESAYLREVRVNKKSRVISYAAPDSLFIQDGIVQRKQLQILVNHLTRPINFINENGEEPPMAYTGGVLKSDSLLNYDKNKLGIKSWATYTATKKTHMRNLYSSQFMDSIPQLKNTAFTFYCVEGGPIDRYEWNPSKSTNSEIKGNYYSTPDFYPRTPDNWKLWNRAWHGWKWINDGRKVEIKAGDKFFSPFIAAGWATNPEADTRPAQWLGLLKCMSVIGAEFYYTGYFNLGKPFSKPENYIWQAAMPAYAQAVTTHFADVFRNGNVLFDTEGNPIVTYPVDDNDVLVTVRKHDKKQQYIIAATVQPSSNTEKFPLNKNIEIKIDDETFIINARRQGSVYFLDKSVKPYVFYQLDRWHQYEHPSRWRKELIYEAEVVDTSSVNIQIKTDYKTDNNKLDFTSFDAFVSLNKNQWVGYTVNSRDVEHLASTIYIMLYVKNEKHLSGEITINDFKKNFSSPKNKDWNWIKIEVPKEVFMKNKYSILKINSSADNFQLDKVVITGPGLKSDFKEY